MLIFQSILGNEIMTLEKEQKKTEISLMQLIALQMNLYYPK
jgi:uncharacterized protein YejL (UPF0352 family)